MYTPPINSTNKEKLDAAYSLLMEERTTLGKFEKIRILIKGMNPELDKILSSVSKSLTRLIKLHKGEVIELAVEMLPGDKEDEKKRKKALLLFISTWKDLKSEVKRIQELYLSQETQGKKTVGQHTSIFTKALIFAKGPLGLTTIAALVVVGVIKFVDASSVAVTIKNQRCSPIPPIAKLPLPIPGVKLPEVSISSGGEAIAIVPPLEITADGTLPGSIGVSAMGFHMNYFLPGETTDLLFDSQSIVGKHTVIKLSKSKTHELVVRCH